MNNDQAQKYIQGGGTKCPYCSSDNIQGGFVEVDCKYADQSMSCIDCDKSWRDVYVLSMVCITEDDTEVVFHKQ